MGYLICEKCGGYYELEEGESLADFDVCQCGGTLKYASVLSDSSHAGKIHQKTENSDRPKLICPNCMMENEGGIFCSNCGGRLITVKGKAGNDIKNLEESKKLEILSHKASRKSKVNKRDFNEPKDIFARISWLGVIAGAGFFLISMFISSLILVLSFFGINPYGYYDYSGLAFAFVVLIILGLIIAIISGGLAAFISKSRDYEDGLINGFLVGLIFSVIFGFLGGIVSMFVGIILFGALAAFGGAIGIFIRNKFVD